jgi:hypothetical protein
MDASLRGAAREREKIKQAYLVVAWWGAEDNTDVWGLRPVVGPSVSESSDVSAALDFFSQGGFCSKPTWTGSEQQI